MESRGPRLIVAGRPTARKQQSRPRLQRPERCFRDSRPWLMFGTCGQIGWLTCEDSGHVGWTLVTRVNFPRPHRGPRPLPPISSLSPDPREKCSQGSRHEDNRNAPVRNRSRSRSSSDFGRAGLTVDRKSDRPNLPGYKNVCQGHEESEPADRTRLLAPSRGQSRMSRRTAISFHS